MAELKKKATSSSLAKESKLKLSLCGNRLLEGHEVTIEEVRKKEKELANRIVYKQNYDGFLLAF